MIDPRLIADVQKSEGCELTSYRDTEGVLTVGWGHALKDQHTPVTWTQSQADDQLQTDLIAAQAFAEALTEYPALDTPCRQNALIELCFELWSRWLPFVNTRAAIRRQDWQGAHDGLLASLWASQVHQTRANRIADYLLNGVYP
jgi:lysozyme